MKRKLFTLSLALLVGVSATFSACGNDAFRLDAFKNDDASGAYDSSNFYRNDLTVFGGDADVLWVDEEQGGEEYGGYFYMYMSGNDGVPMQYFPDGHKEAVTVLRSKDLNDWQLCGKATEDDYGFSCYLDAESWPVSHVWAPEVIYNDPDFTYANGSRGDGKYYMYFNCFGPWHTDETDPDNEYNIEMDNFFDRFYGAVLVSDTPVGPFRLATSERYYGDKYAKTPNGKVITEMTPHINITRHFALSEVFSVIDFSPFFDERTGELYLYFVRHVSTGHDHNCLWGVKMKDMITPDYSTLTMLGACNHFTVTKDVEDLEPWDESAYNLGETWIDKNGVKEEYDGIYGHEGGINEGPQMMEKDGRYFLIYSPRGFASRTYSARQAIGSSPLGPFTKLPENPGAIMNANDTNDYITGTGHQTFVERDGELFCIYYAHSDPYSGDLSSPDGRIYAFDRVHYVDVDGYGTLLYGNGPTKSLQPKPYGVIGKRNVAPEGRVTATNAVDKNAVKYLNDGLFVSHEYFSDWEFESKGETTITITFDEPKEVSAVMVYNSFDYAYAFSAVDKITFALTEKPSWFTKGKYTPLAYISNIAVWKEYYNEEEEFMRQGGSAVASFNPVKTNKITIKISKKISADFGKNIRISDIVVLGK